MLKQLNPFLLHLAMQIFRENELLEMQEGYRLRQLPERIA